MTALLLDIGNGSGSLGVVRCLGTARIPVDVLSPKLIEAGRSKYCRAAYQCPPISNQNDYIDSVFDRLSEDQYDVLFISEDRIAELLDPCRADLAQKVNALLPPSESMRIALSKIDSVVFAESVGIPVPKTSVPENEEQLGAIAENLLYPVVVKGEKGTAADLIRYASSRQDLLADFRDIESSEAHYGGRPSIQEMIAGPEYLVHVLCNRGELIRICCHEKTLRYPIEGGTTAVGVTVDEPELVRLATIFFESLQWHGLAKIDFIRDRIDGKFKLISVDPRVSASIDLPRFAGVNFPHLLHRLAAGERLDKDLTYRVGVQYRWVLPREVLYSIAKPMHIPVALFSIFNPKSYSDIQMTDPVPAFWGLRNTLWSVKDHMRKGTLLTGGAPRSP